ncbi:MAG TPA: hypothetical protein VEK08_17585 [Planctomycetota bacterium]|nr:hypothetical protein [Planctomycetota bacterium]
MADFIVPAAIVCGLYIWILLLIARRSWRNFRQNDPTRAFNYSITDIYALMLGLAPSIALGVHAMSSPDNAVNGFWLLPLFPAQLLGAFCCRVLMKIEDESSALSTARAVVMGAWMGATLGLALPVFLVVMMVIFALNPFIMFLGAGLTITVVALMRREDASKARQ